MDAEDDFDLLRLLFDCESCSLFRGDDLGLDLLLVRDLSLLDFKLLRVLSSLGLDLLLLLRPSSRRDLLVAWDLTDFASPRVDDDLFNVTSALLLLWPSPLDDLLGGGGGGFPLLDDGRLFFSVDILTTVRPTQLLLLCIVVKAVLCTV